MRYLRSLLIAAGVIITATCAKTDRRAAAIPTAQSGIGEKRAASSIPADTEVVRSPGVPTDADDTGSTRYGKHYTPRRLRTPDCRPQGVALCIRDTALRVYSVNCCMADERQTDWLVFAAAGDSLQVFLDSYHDAYLTMAPVIATGASQPIGGAAQLNVTGTTKASIAVAPRSMMPQDDTAALRRFAVKSGAYHVLLVRDTLYSACTLPCTHRKVFTLKPGQSVTVAP